MMAVWAFSSGNGGCSTNSRRAVQALLFIVKGNGHHRNRQLFIFQVPRHFQHHGDPRGIVAGGWKPGPLSVIMRANYNVLVGSTPMRHHVAPVASEFLRQDRIPDLPHFAGNEFGRCCATFHSGMTSFSRRIREPSDGDLEPVRGNRGDA